MVTEQNQQVAVDVVGARRCFDNGEIRMVDLVDIAIPANAQAAAESLGLTISRSVTSGTRVRQIPREDAEIAVVCLRELGFSARLLEKARLDGEADPGAALSLQRRRP
jgi:hypothetical protein